MTFTVNTLSRDGPAGCDHIIGDLTIGGQSFTLRVTRDEAVTLEPEDVRGAILIRLRSAVKEAGVGNNLAAIKAFLEGKTYQL